MPFLRVDQSEIHYESIRIENPIREEVIIFLHEALGSIPQWRNFPEECCHKLRLNGILYERQGHGASSSFSSERTDEYLHDYAWKEMPQVIDALIPPEKRIILIGHSDGGSIALLYAAKFSKKVSACITLAAHVINEPETIAGIDPALKAFSEGKLEKLRLYHKDKTDDLFKAWANTWRRDSFKSWNICREIQSIEVPVLAIQGKADQYGTEKQLDLIKGNCRFSSTKFINGLGHHPHLEKSTTIIELIREMMNSIDPGNCAH
jgi:pimeloyl-ACP methyl ester carboxylesterase